MARSSRSAAKRLPRPGGEATATTRARTPHWIQTTSGLEICHRRSNVCSLANPGHVKCGAVVRRRAARGHRAARNAHSRRAGEAARTGLAAPSAVARAAARPRADAELKWRQSLLYDVKEHARSTASMASARSPCESRFHCGSSQSSGLPSAKCRCLLDTVDRASAFRRALLKVKKRTTALYRIERLNGCAHLSFLDGRDFELPESWSQNNMSNQRVFNSPSDGISESDPQSRQLE
jgi:hypothetical protein